MMRHNTPRWFCSLAFVTFALAGFIAGCGGTTDPEERLVLALSVAPTQVLPGGDFTASLTVSNPSSRAVTVTSPSTCPFALEIVDARGQRVSQGGNSLCGMSYTDLRFDPGETRVADISWSATGLNVEPLPSGTYEVRGVLVLTDGASQRSPPSALLVQE